MRLAAAVILLIVAITSTSAAGTGAARSEMLSMPSGMAGGTY